MLEIFILISLAAGQITITQRKSIEICTLNLSGRWFPSGQNLVIQLSSKDQPVPLLLLMTKNWDPGFFFNTTANNYQVNADYFDFEAWSQNLENSYIKVPDYALKSSDILHIGIYSEIIGITYKISWYQLQSNVCTPYCNSAYGDCMDNGACNCTRGPYSGYDCGVLFTKVKANETGENFEVSAGSWAFFYYDLPYTSDFTVKISNSTGDPRFYYKLFTEDQYLPSMLNAWLQIWFDPDKTEISYTFPNAKNYLWTLSEDNLRVNLL